jgi:hypothetical protein
MRISSRLLPLLPVAAFAFSMAALEPYYGPPRFARAVALKGWVQVTDADDSATFDVNRNEPLAEGDYLTLADNARLNVALPGGGRMIIGGPARLEVARIAGRKLTVLLLRGELLIENGETRDISVTSEYGRVTVEPDSRVLFYTGSNGVDVSVLRGAAQADNAADHPIQMAMGESLNLSLPKLGAVEPSYKLDAGNLTRWADAGRRARKADPNAARAAAWLRENLPAELVDSLAELDDWGRWQLLPDYGWVWHPDGGRDWMPFTHGQWRYTPWGLFWLADEPWGWLPYRYGVWRYRMDIGWFWIPDESYSGAAVVFVEDEQSVGWCPGYEQGGAWLPSSGFCGSAPRADFYAPQAAVSRRQLSSFTVPAPMEMAGADGASPAAAAAPRAAPAAVRAPARVTRKLDLRPDKPGPRRKAARAKADDDGK